jgi:hypothetical protein
MTENNADMNRSGNSNNDNRFEEEQRASAIAQVAALPTAAIGPISTLRVTAAAAGTTTGTTTTTRGNEAADEALQTGDLQNIDGPGAEVKALFIEFLFGL